MTTTQAKPSAARERILETAQQLFYAEGVRAVGVDRIIAEAGVAKMTLYKHFPSKDELVLAVLEAREATIIEYFTSGIERKTRRGAGKVEAFFAVLKDWFRGKGFRGCAFINAAVELADANHPASMFATAHKARFREMLQALLEEEVGAKAADEVLPAVALLVEGAIVSATMDRRPAAADEARDAAFALVDQHRG